jgi:hypothetical protein
MREVLAIEQHICRVSMFGPFPERDSTAIRAALKAITFLTSHAFSRNERPIEQADWRSRFALEGVSEGSLTYHRARGLFRNVDHSRSAAFL